MGLAKCEIDYEKNEELLVITVKDSESTELYQKKYTKDLLDNLDPGFQKYRSLKNIQEDMKKVFSQSTQINYTKEDNSIKISFQLSQFFVKDLTIPKKKNSKNDEEKIIVLELLKSIKENIVKYKEIKRQLQKEFEEKKRKKELLIEENRKLLRECETLENQRGWGNQGDIKKEEVKVSFSRGPLQVPQIIEEERLDLSSIEAEIEEANRNNFYPSISKVPKYDNIKLLDTKVKSESSFEVVNCVLTLDDDRLIISEKKKEIFIFNLINEDKCDLLKGHEDEVLYLCRINKFSFASCSKDKTIKIWDSKSLKCIQTLTGHQDQINKVIVGKYEMLFSCCSDGKIYCWSKNCDLYSCEKQFTDHKDAVVSILRLESINILVSSSGEKEKSLRFWDLTKFKLNKTISNVYCYSANGLMELKKLGVILVGNENGVIVVNSKEYYVIKKIERYCLKNVSSFLLVGETILCGCGEGYLVQLSSDSIEYIGENFIGENQILTLGFSNIYYEGYSNVFYVGGINNCIYFCAII